MIRVVEAAYASAFVPGQLPRVLALVDSYLGVTGSYLLAVGERGAEVRAAGPGAASLAAQHARLSGVLFVPAEQVAALPPGELLAMRGAPGFFEAMQPSDHAADWGQGLAAVLSVGRDAHTLLVVPRPFQETRSLECIMQALQALLPYLHRAFLLTEGVEGSLLPLSGVGQLLRSFPMPCVVTDSAGRCLEANESFQRALPVLSMQLASGRVRFDDPYLHTSWQSALFETSETAVRRTIVAGVARGRQWRVHLLPIRCLALEQALAARALILSLFEEQVPQQKPLAESFSSVSKLTPAEIDVLSGLLQGYTAKVIARSRGASVNTVRSQIMAILGKTGHRSQKELIAAFGASSFDTSSFESQP